MLYTELKFGKFVTVGDIKITALTCDQNGVKLSIISRSSIEVMPDWRQIHISIKANHTFEMPVKQDLSFSLNESTIKIVSVNWDRMKLGIDADKSIEIKYERNKRTA